MLYTVLCRVPCAEWGGQGRRLLECTAIYYNIRKAKEYYKAGTI